MNDKNADLVFGGPGFSAQIFLKKYEKYVSQAAVPCSMRPGMGHTF